MTGQPVLERPRITAREFDWIRSFLLQRTGIELRDGKQTLVVGRLDRRVRALGLRGFGAYVELLASGTAPEEERTAVDLLTTNETYFYREPRHFDLLPDLLPPARPGAPEQPVRVWSAACSSGEETCTVALVLATHLGGTRPWEVLGTDISRRVLETAQRGLYPVEAAERIPVAVLREHCRRGRGPYEGMLALAPELRRRIRYAPVNLVEPLPDLGLFDVVLLRNVMIYFGQETKRALLQRVVAQIRPGGHLLIGHAESVTGLVQGLEPVAPAVFRVVGTGS